MTMKLKLVDIVGEADHDVTFGTCELCSFTRDLYYDNYIVEDEKGERHTFTNGYWSWGDWFTIVDSKKEINVIDIAEWVSRQDFVADKYGYYEDDFFNKMQRYIWDVEGGANGK